VVGIGALALAVLLVYSVTRSGEAKGVLGTLGSSARTISREELGRHGWALLHSMAAHVPEQLSVEKQLEMHQFLTLL
jgi:hypothetical protein